MTAKEVMGQALALLNYTDPSGDVNGRQNAELLKRTVPVVNQVLADIRHILGEELELVRTATDTLPVSEDTAMRVMVPGVCTYIAQSEHDGEQQQLYAAQYEQARGTLKRQLERVLDVIPRPR